MLRIIPEMTPKDLGKMPKHLPEPTYIEVRLAGQFDYSSLLSRMEEEGAKLQNNERVILNLDVTRISEEFSAGGRIKVKTNVSIGN